MDQLWRVTTLFRAEAAAQASPAVAAIAPTPASTAGSGSGGSITTPPASAMAGCSTYRPNADRSSSSKCRAQLV